MERTVTTRTVGLWQKGGRDRAAVDMDTPHLSRPPSCSVWPGQTWRLAAGNYQNEKSN
jgi:hypothetical protein